MEISVYMIPITLGVAFAAMMVAISYFSSKSKSDKARYQAEVQARLIDKFSTGPEFVQFLESPQGRKFLGEIESAPKVRTQDRMLSGIRNATVLSFLGVAFVLLSLFTYEHGMIFPGLLLLALGLGYLASVILTKRLSREWGMFEEHPPTTTLAGIHPPSES
jgi:peptidoglycan/LPS O-acetylase OafA/YrhL